MLPSVLIAAPVEDPDDFLEKYGGSITRSISDVQLECASARSIFESSLTTLRQPQLYPLKPRAWRVSGSRPLMLLSGIVRDAGLLDDRFQPAMFGAQSGHVLHQPADRRLDLGGGRFLLLEKLRPPGDLGDAPVIGGLLTLLRGANLQEQPGCSGDADKQGGEDQECVIHVSTGRRGGSVLKPGSRATQVMNRLRRGLSLLALECRVMIMICSHVPTRARMHPYARALGAMEVAPRRSSNRKTPNRKMPRDRQRSLRMPGKSAG